MMNKLLSDLYYNPAKSSSFSSPQRLLNEAKKINSNIQINDVKDWLASQNAYTLHKQVRHVFPRNKVLASEPGEHMQADLVDMSMFANVNNGYKYILMVIDVFSKFLFAFPLKDKSGPTLKKAFEFVFAFNKPQNLQTDEGTEFTNRHVQNFFKDALINHFVAKNKAIKASVVERVNKTIKGRMFKYFTAKGTRKWIDILPLLVQGYNESYHRSIKMRPIDVTAFNKKQVFKNLYNLKNRREYLFQTPKTIKFKVGDNVRIAYMRKTFHKGYYPNWSDHIYTVEKIIKGERPLFILKSANGKILKKRFYQEEIQKVRENLYLIEKIISKRGDLVLVKWLNFPDSYNSWIPVKEIEKL